MATLRIKNKYEVSLLKLLKETGEDGGIPENFEVSGKEAWDILNEIRAVKQTRFVIEPTTEYDPQFILKSSTDKLDPQTAQELVTRWYSGEFKVILRKEKFSVPLKVIPNATPKKEVETKSESSDT